MVSLRLVALGVALSALFPLKASDSLEDQIRTAQAQGDYSGAARLYVALIRSGSDTPEIRTNLGIMYHLAGQHEAALKQLRTVLARNPKLPGANLFAGLAEISLGRPGEGIPYLQRAVALDPRGPVPLMALGRANLALRDFREAKRYYAKAAQLAPTLPEAWYGVGITNRSLAEKILNKSALGQTVDKDEARTLLAEALEALNRAVELDPQSPRAHLIQAESLRDSGDYSGSAAEYKTAIRLDPKLDAAYLGLATCYWKSREFEEALPLLRKLLLTSPKDPEANGILADILEHNGDYSEALQHAQLALAGNPDLIETHLVLARVYLAQRVPEQAIAALQPVLAADSDGSYHFLLSRAYKLAGDEDKAGVALARFHELRTRASAQ